MQRQPALAGAKFIEFSANEEEASQLGHMLQTLGFAPPTVIDAKP